MQGIPLFEHKLGYSFTDKALLNQGLTHRSFGSPHNERLEFLGDGILNCLIAIELYIRFPRLREGELSRLRAHLVREATLHEIAQSLQIGDLVLLGEGELKSGGFTRPSILADAFEGVIGAVFLDGGFDAARAVVAHLFDTLLGGLDELAHVKDPKTELQEILQGRRAPLPVYEVQATTGAAHNQIFEVRCVIESLAIETSGRGSSRRLAEQAAAREALEKVRT
ncbi:MAG: ribonuclease III [Burkholderiales bacterium]